MSGEVSVRLFVPSSLAELACSQALANSPRIRIVQEPAPFDVAIFDCGPAHCLPFLSRDREWRNVKVLVISAATGPDECLQWIEQGAWGVLSPDRCAEELTNAVLHVAGGRFWATREVVRVLLAERQQHQRPLSAGLTTTESRIARLLAAGLSNPQIADLLCVAAGTVKWHVYRIYRKFGVHSRTQFISVWGSD